MLFIHFNSELNIYCCINYLCVVVWQIPLHLQTFQTAFSSSIFLCHMTLSASLIHACFNINYIFIFIILYVYLYIYVCDCWFAVYLSLLIYSFLSICDLHNPRKCRMKRQQKPLLFLLNSILYQGKTLSQIYVCMCVYILGFRFCRKNRPVKKQERSEATLMSNEINGGDFLSFQVHDQAHTLKGEKSQPYILLFY